MKTAKKRVKKAESQSWAALEEARLAAHRALAKLEAAKAELAFVEAVGPEPKELTVSYTTRITAEVRVKVPKGVTAGQLQEWLEDGTVTYQHDYTEMAIPHKGGRLLIPINLALDSSVIEDEIGEWEVAEG